MVFLVLLLLGSVLLFYRLEDRDLWSSHEARAAINAQGLLLPESDGLPRLHQGQLETQKPPLYYWLVALIAYTRGGTVDEFAVRLPSTLAAFGILLLLPLVVGFGFRRPLAGVLASLLLVTGIHFPWLARIGRIDMPLAFCVSLAAMAFVLAQHHHRAWLILLYLSAALGVLLKGPIGLLLPAAIVAASLLLQRRWPAFWEWPAWRSLLTELALGRGVLLVAVLTLPVFLWLHLASAGQFTHEFFWLHNLQRGFGGARLRTHPFWLYAPYLLLYLLPWSVLLFTALPRFWKTDPLAQFGMAWLLGVLLLLSLSRFKRADYLLPAYPGAALLCACWLERQLAGPWRRPLFLALSSLSLLMLLGWTYHLTCILPAEESYRDYRLFASLVRRHAGQDPVFFFRAEAHALSFRVGRPLVHLVEWHHLHQQLHQPGPHWVIMPPEVVDEARSQPWDVHWQVISRLTDVVAGPHERPLVLLKSSPRASHASLSLASPRRQPTP